MDKLFKIDGKYYKEVKNNPKEEEYDDDYFSKHQSDMAGRRLLTTRGEKWYKQFMNIPSRQRVTLWRKLWAKYNKGYGSSRDLILLLDWFKINRK